MQPRQIGPVRCRRSCTAYETQRSSRLIELAEQCSGRERIGISGRYQRCNCPMLLLLMVGPPVRLGSRAGRHQAGRTDQQGKQGLAHVTQEPVAAVMAFALAISACAMRMLAMSISLPSSDTAPRPSFAACAMASMIRRALVTSASEGV